ncbi:hypothetical protein VTN49DRAFT_100 [Thermomyces lanuginosus]|uniref:uncharacterized protein n=1 Tax=Thermomyces lanuginosus TaxID=5541 RepID=UPI0037425C7E
MLLRTWNEDRTSPGELPGRSELAPRHEEGSKNVGQQPKLADRNSEATRDYLAAWTVRIEIRILLSYP